MKFKEGQVYNVKTQKAYDHLMKELEEDGWELCGGLRPTQWRVWSRFEKTTCISLKSKNSIDYCGINYYKSNGQTILTYYYPKTLRDVEEGDILVDGDDEYKVLGVHKYMVHLSSISDFESMGSDYTFKELNNCGYKLKDDTDEEEKTKKQDLIDKADELRKKADELLEQAKNI